MNKIKAGSKSFELFGEDDFNEKINTIVRPFLKKYAQEDYFDSYDGKKIHYYQIINPDERASIVILHGFCEFFEKYHEVAFYLFEMGYSVFFIEHRGHGKSYRDLPEELDKVHIINYNQYIYDLKIFMDKVVVPKSSTSNIFMYAHSMGGCIGTLFLETYPDYFKAAVLSSPMHQVNVGKVPPFVVKILLAWMKIIKKEKAYAPGQYGFDEINVFEESGALSKNRYNYAFEYRKKVPEYRTYGGSYAWTRASLKATKKVQKEAWKIKIPVLLFQAGNDNMVVSKGQEKVLSQIKESRKIVFSESKHEIFNSTEKIRKEYYNFIFNFYEENIKDKQQEE